VTGTGSRRLKIGEVQSGVPESIVCDPSRTDLG
jgi:hypothetical protein